MQSAAAWKNGTESIFGSQVEVAEQISKTILFELGLTISVGVSFNKVFAKLGSDQNKPHGMTVIERDSFRETVWPLPVADLLGVGRATQQTPEKMFIHTIGDLATADPERLRQKLGNHGISLWRFANGQDHSAVHNKDFQSLVKSIGHGTTTIADLTNEQQVWLVMLELTQEIGHKLRTHQKMATGVAIHVRDSDLYSKQWQTQFVSATQSPLLIAQAAYEGLSILQNLLGRHAVLFCGRLPFIRCSFRLTQERSKQWQAKNSRKRKF